MTIDYERNIEEIVVVFGCQDLENWGRMMAMQVDGDNVRKMKRRNTCIQKVSLEQTKMRVLGSPA